MLNAEDRFGKEQRRMARMGLMIDIRSILQQELYRLNLTGPDRLMKRMPSHAIRFVEGFWPVPSS